MKRYVLTIFIDEERILGSHEEADNLQSSDLRDVIAILEQKKLGLLMLLNKNTLGVPRKQTKQAKRKAQAD